MSDSQDQNQTGATHLNGDEFQETISSSEKPVFVDFYADWCGPCKMAAPIVDKLAGEYADRAVIAKVNTDENREIAMGLGIMSIPTVIVFKNGQEVDRKLGFPGEAG